MNQTIRHVLDGARWKPQRQAAALMTLTLFVGILIGALYLSQSAATSSLGRQLEVLIAERNNLEQANEQLRAEVAALQSVPRLQNRALELGFNPARSGDIEYIVVDGYVPRGAQIAPVTDVIAKPAPVYEESFSGWLAQVLDGLIRQIEGFTQQGAQ